MDLFEDYEKLPKDVLAVVSKYGDIDMTYETCESFKSEVNKLGYTFEYGLDATPFNLQLLTDKI